MAGARLSKMNISRAEQKDSREAFATFEPEVPKHPPLLSNLKPVVRYLRSVCLRITYTLSVAIDNLCIKSNWPRSIWIILSQSKQTHNRKVCPNSTSFSHLGFFLLFLEPMKSMKLCRTDSQICVV